MRWLKRLIRDWLLDEDARPQPALSRDIEVRNPDGSMDRLTATGTCGMHLLCEGYQGQRLVGVNQVRDRKHFHELWSQLNSQRMCWEDGTPFMP